MKPLEDYRDPARVARLAAALHARVTRPWTVMEICGGQTHAILRHGLDTLLPPQLTLLHGPGCPVCVTPASAIDQALTIATTPGAVLCSFGDMLRVPGSGRHLLMAKAEGGDVRTVYSPLDAVDIAATQPQRQVVFFAVGFETTAPANALAVLEAERRGLHNFSLLTAQVRVPPAIEALLAAPDNRVQGFLAAGHVCAVMGTGEYAPLAARFGVPMVVTGFEPVDILQGLLACVEQLETGRAEVEIQYRRAVRPDGNPAARAALARVFEPVDQVWRGLGRLPASGLALRPGYAHFDARRRFGLDAPQDAPGGECIAGDILSGRRSPPDCPAFGRRCRPETPLGAPMVSSEGACAAYYHYRQEYPRP